MRDDSRDKLREMGIVALVSAGHFWSHFFMLAIPSALPLIREDLGASNASLGLIMAAFALMGAGFQFPMGILTDRLGARVFLIAGFAVESLAVFSQSLAPSVPVMIALAFVAGIADSVFHPADYTILTAKVRQPWLGRAFAIHTFTGFLGFAVAPTAMTFLLVYGTWRDALALIGLAGLATAAVQMASGTLLSGVTYPPQRAPGGPVGRSGLLGLLLSPPLLLMFLFYAFATFSSSGLQNFGNSALISLYQLDIIAANKALAAFLWGTAIGILGGGLLTVHIKRFDAVVTVCYLLAAALLCLIGFAALPYAGMAAALFFAGFVLGVVAPARDLMVRAVTPPGSTGKTFGYVSSGFGVGGVVGPLVYGGVMDFDLPQLLFFVSACAMLAVIAVALLASYVAKRAGAPGLRAPA